MKQELLSKYDKEILREEKKAFVLGAGGEVDTKDRERATKKEWEEKLESFAAGSFQLSRGQWPPKGSERALLGSCGQPMNKGNWHTYFSFIACLSYALSHYWSYPIQDTEVLSQQVQHLTRGVAGRKEGRSKYTESLILCCSCPVLCWF